MFSADVESDQPGIAYLNVKLNKDKQEFASLNSPTAPGGRQRLELFFDTGDADAMAVLCRVQPMAGAVGKNVLERGAGRHGERRRQQQAEEQGYELLTFHFPFLLPP